MTRTHDPFQERWPLPRLSATDDASTTEPIPVLEDVVVDGEPAAPNSDPWASEAPQATPQDFAHLAEEILAELQTELESQLETMVTEAVETAVQRALLQYRAEMKERLHAHLMQRLPGLLRGD